MFGWSDLRFLRAVSRTGSTVAAACALGVNRTKVARRINALERALRLFAGLATACLLPACTTTSMPSVAQEENEGISGYVACLDAAARRMDDGRSDVAAVAAAIKGVCAARFPEPAKAPGAAMSAATRQKSEARQMELSTMVVQDLRGQP
jgi:Bacterial regulatory helix-turn-helix protein, lysR family